MSRSKVWVPAVASAVLLGGMAVGPIIDDGQEAANLSSRTASQAEAAARGGETPAVSLPGLGDQPVPPFAELVSRSNGVLQGRVVDVSEVKWNLPAGERYDPEKEYPYDPITFTTVTVAVDRWLYNDGSLPLPEVVLMVPGGRIKEVLTRQEIVDLVGLDHHPEVDPYEVVPGGIVYTGDDPWGGLVFSLGERVVLLVGNLPFSTPGGVTRVPQVTGYGAGKFLVGPSGELLNDVVSQPDAPKSLAELENLIRQVKGGS